MPLNFNGTEIGTLKMGTTEIANAKMGSTDIYESDFPINKLTLDSNHVITGLWYSSSYKMLIAVSTKYENVTTRYSSGTKEKINPTEIRIYRYGGKFGNTWYKSGLYTGFINIRLDNTIYEGGTYIYALDRQLDRSLIIRTIDVSTGTLSSYTYSDHSFNLPVRAARSISSGKKYIIYGRAGYGEDFNEFDLMYPITSLSSNSLSFDTSSNLQLYMWHGQFRAAEPYNGAPSYYKQYYYYPFNSENSNRYRGLVLYIPSTISSNTICLSSIYDNCWTQPGSSQKFSCPVATSFCFPLEFNAKVYYNTYRYDGYISDFKTKAAKLTEIPDVPSGFKNNKYLFTCIYNNNDIIFMTQSGDTAQYNEKRWLKNGTAIS